jgi:sulfur carrier protein ThiS
MPLRSWLPKSLCTSELSSVAASFSIMSDVSEADSISDSTNARVDDGGGDEASSISSAVRELCHQLRVNDPHVLAYDFVFVPFDYHDEYSEGERIEVFQALKENTSLKHIRLWLNSYTKSSVETAAKYLESSKTLQALNLRYGDQPAVISLLFQALSRNTSVSKLLVDTRSVRYASVAFSRTFD